LLRSMMWLLLVTERKKYRADCIKKTANHISNINSNFKYQYEYI
jgi:hypothetical protein